MVPTRLYRLMRLLFLVVVSAFGQVSRAQDSLLHDLRFLHFPLSPKRAWTWGAGLTATAMPYEVAEEFRYRIPAFELRGLARINQKIALETRASLQGFQNLLSIGPRLNFRLTDRMSVAAGNNIAWWFGFVNVQGFRTRGHGLQNFPYLSAGYRFNRQVLLSVHAESIMTLGSWPRAGDIRIHDQRRLFSGSAYTLMLEQPFAGRKRLALGFRAQYTSFFWQTWSIFPVFERNYFYPQLITCLIL